MAVPALLACLAASCASAPALPSPSWATALAATSEPLPAAVTTPAPPVAPQEDATGSTKALQVRAGLYNLSVGDESEVGLGIHLGGDFQGESEWGGGADLFLATTFGDAEPADGPYVNVRLWAYALYAHPTSPIVFKVGPEIIRASVGDEFGGEYNGFGLKASIYGETEVGETMTGFGEFGLGFNSGDGEVYESGFEFDEEYTIVDIMAGVRSESGLAGGIDLQFLGADVGADLEAIGLFLRFDF